MSTSTSVGLSTSKAQGVILPALGEQSAQLVRVLGQLARGGTSSKGTFTLPSNGATTLTVSHVNCMPYSIISWTPVTADAAAQMATMYLLSSNVTTGQFTVTQATNTSTSSIFNYIIHS